MDFSGTIGGCSRWTLGMMAAAGLLLESGCSTRSGGPGASRSGAAVAAKQVAPPSAPTVAEWVSIAFDGPGDAGTEARVLAEIRGNERAFFEAVLGRLAREPRDVSAVVRFAARSWVNREGAKAAAEVVSEVWSRECCLRRSFLVGALEGVRDGMGGSNPGNPARVVDASTALKLAELSEHADEGVARAARVLSGRFSMGPGADVGASGNR